MRPDAAVEVTTTDAARAVGKLSFIFYIKMPGTVYVSGHFYIRINFFLALVSALVLLGIEQN